MDEKNNKKLRNIKSKLIFIIRFGLIMTVISKIKVDRIIVSSTTSLTAVFKNCNGKVLFCNREDDLCGSDYTNPNKIKINNNNEESYNNENNYNLDQEENIVKLSWENDMTDCRCIFSGCVNLISLDFSDFDTSKITTFERMFVSCENLVSLDLTNFNTTLVNNLREMFYHCYLLTSLDLSSFDTTQVTNIFGIFEGCYSLSYLDISTFDTSKIKSMRRMFWECKSLPYLDISHFNTSLVTTMYGMFQNCYFLTSLNLFNFEIYEETNTNGIFNGNANLTYINLGNATIQNENFITQLSSLSSDLHISVNNETMKFLKFFKDLNIDLNFNFDIWVDKEIITTYLVKESTAYKIYSSSYIITSINNLENVITNTVYNTYIDNSFSNIITNTNNIGKVITNTVSNSYKSNTYSDLEKNNDNLYNNINTISTGKELTYIKELYSDEMKKSYIINKDNYFENKTELLIRIREEMIKGKFLSNNISNISKEISSEFQEDSIFIEVTTTEEQKYIEENITNKTSINLDKCEYIIKNKLNISNSSALYILKIDIQEKGYKIPKILYELYFPFNDLNLTKLDLMPCINQKIEHLIPVSLDYPIEQHNQSSDYYNDICSTTTSKYGTDLSLPDRKDIFIDNNMTLCEENCKLVKYDYKKKKAKCSCDIKLSIPFLIDDIRINKYELYKSFTDIKNIINFKIMKCYATVFTFQSLKSNYGSYIITFIIIIYLICLILFLAKYYLLLKVEIAQLVKKIEPQSSIIKQKEINQNKQNKSKRNKTFKKNQSSKRLNNSKLNQLELNLKREQDNIINKRNNKKKRTKQKKSVTERKLKKTIIKEESANADNTNIELMKQKDDINNNINDKNNNIEYSDLELNTLKYEEALKIDKRTYIQYYISLLRTNNLFIFSFYPNKDYNSQIIKFFLFFFLFTVHFTVNALFFNDKTMHQIYKDKGAFNIIYQIPQIIYSALISGIIGYVIKKLGLSEKMVIELKREKKIEQIKNKENEVLNLIKIKFIIFFLFSFVFLGAFWYYITCFCGVYINNKIHLIKDSFISFCLSLVYPFGIYLIPGLFRIHALKAKDKECMYKLSNFLEIL